MAGADALRSAGEFPGKEELHPADPLCQALSHVYWIGGSPCSGKTSLARRLVERFGWEYYDCDQAFWRHKEIVTPAAQPVFYRVMHLSPEDLWMRPVEQQVREEFAIYREEFPLILADLLALPRTRPVLAEGAALLPECVAPLLAAPSPSKAQAAQTQQAQTQSAQMRMSQSAQTQPVQSQSAPTRTMQAHRAIWVVPTAEFQRYHYSRRPWTADILKDTSDPARAFDNWMQRDIRFAQQIHHNASNLGLRVLVVDGQRSLEENYLLVKDHFELNS